MMPRTVLVPIAAGLAACAGTPLADLSVREAGRSAQCNTPDALPRAELLQDAAAVRDWQRARRVELVPADSIGDRPHVVVEIGARPTGGYAVALGPAATVDGDTIAVTAMVRAPAPGAMVSQALTSPCVLGELPAGAYRQVEVRDASGATWLRSSGMPGASE